VPGVGTRTAGEPAVATNQGSVVAETQWPLPWAHLKALNFSVTQEDDTDGKLPICKTLKGVRHVLGTEREVLSFKQQLMRTSYKELGFRPGDAPDAAMSDKRRRTVVQLVEQAEEQWWLLLNLQEEVQELRRLIQIMRVQFAGMSEDERQSLAKDFAELRRWILLKQCPKRVFSTKTSEI
jgi:hypothetical protein